jgi:glycosyltransferase involved in cell wall biosynthesis
MTQAPLISILLPSYNYGRYIGATIESVLAQTCGDFELIISDDASTDDSRDVIRRFQDPRIRYFEQPKNLGNIAHFARMYALCRGEFLAYIDSDDLWAPEKLARQLATFQADPKLGLVATHIRTIDAEGRASPEPDATAAWFNTSFDPNDWASWLHQNRICMSSILARKSAHDAVGVRSAGLTVAADWELWLRFRARGIPFAIVPESLTVYRVHDRGLWGRRGAEALRQHVFIAQAVLYPALRAAQHTDLIRRDFAMFLRHPDLNGLPPAERTGLLAILAGEQPAFLQYPDLQAALANPPVRSDGALQALQWTGDLLVETLAWEAKLADAVQHSQAHAQRLETGVFDYKQHAQELLQWTEQLSAAKAHLQAQLAGAEAALSAAQLARQAEKEQLEAQPWYQAAIKQAAAQAWAEAIPLAPVVNRSMHCFEQVFDEPAAGTRVYQGWAFAYGHLLTRVRARALTPATQCIAAGEMRPRPDVAAAIPHEPGAGASGFTLRVPLRAGENLILLEVQSGNEWLPFLKEPVTVTSVARDPVSAEPAPLVSIVIPCFNYGRFVREAVDSALAQTWPALEVIVVDDGSTEPETVRVLDELSDPRLRLIRTENRKLPAARNRGIRESRGAFLCCLDADDRLAPTYVEKCLFQLTATGAEICGAWQQNFGKETELLRPGEFTVESLWSVNRMINAALFTRALWEDAGGYDEALVHGYEDWDFWIRCAKAGAIAAIVPEPLFFYRKHGPSMIDATRARHAEIVARIRQTHYAGGQARATLRVAPAPATGDIWRDAPVIFPTGGESPRVLLALPWLVLGGVDSLLSQICRHLADRGVRLSIVTTESPTPEQGDTTALFAAITPEIYHLPRFLPQPHWPAFLRYLVQSRAATHLLLAGSTFTYHQLPALHDVRPDLRVLDLLFNTEGHTANNRRFAHHLDLTLCENAGIRDWLLARGEWPERICVVPNGVDLGKFRPAAPAAARARLAGLRPDALTVGFLGRFSHEKAADAFLALAAACAAEPRLQFVLAGAGPAEAGLRDQARELRLENVLWPGVVDSAAVLPAFDILVVPSRLDGRPNAVLEAMACGIPVVASRVGGLPELVEHGVTGLLVEPLDLPGLAAAVTRLSRDSALRMSMAHAARAKAERELDIHRTFATYETLICGGAA